MKLHKGVYFPDNERHMVEWCDKAGEMIDGTTTYQYHKLRAAMQHVTQFRTAVDVGGHIGTWSMQLVKKFDTLHAFEPVAAHRECWVVNVENAAQLRLATHKPKFHLHACALGDHEDMIKITTAPTSTGDSRVDGHGDIPMHTLDSFNLQDVDLVKIDVEGFELYVIKGAEETIKSCRPVMIVEQKGHGMKYFGFRKEEGVELLESWGMKRAQNMSGDWIMVW